jgi:hypothetical protein
VATLRSGGRFNKHVQQVFGAKTYLVAGQSDNARITGPEHFNHRTAPQPELFELMHMVGMAENAKNAPATAFRKLPQGYDFGMVCFFHEPPTIATGLYLQWNIIFYFQSIIQH